ncbi:MAG TPA: hypothetical protein VN702_16370 [Acetobacteraceae bacterium]|nr:hypothetical protein [Acetobacteraceae bacterium]
MKTSLDPSGRVMLGQQVRLLVDVLLPGEMPHPPRVTAPRVDGAQVFRFESQATTISERTDSANYVGQRIEFDIYPRRAGVLTVPPVAVTLLDKAGDVTETRQGAGLSIPAVAPPGLNPSGPIVVSRNVALHEEWQSAGVKTLHVGDVLTRRVTRTAAGVPGLALANLAFTAPDGIRVYVDPPDIQDRIERGEVTGIRTDRATYLIERAGSFLIPGISQPWWDQSSGVARSLIVPARTLEVTAASPPPSHSPLRRAAVAGAAIAAIIFVGLGVIVRCGIAERWARWRAGREQAERAAFKTLRRECRRADPAAVYRAWQAWNATRPAGAHEPALDDAIRDLERHLFGKSTSWTAADGTRLLRAVSASRGKRRTAPVRSILPPLNPGWEEQPHPPGAGAF